MWTRRLARSHTFSSGTPSSISSSSRTVQICSPIRPYIVAGRRTPAAWPSRSITPASRSTAYRRPPGQGASICGNSWRAAAPKPPGSCAGGPNRSSADRPPGPFVRIPPVGNFLPLRTETRTGTSRPMLNKITVVGAGNVGATAAKRLAEKELARRVVLVDVIEGVPQGKGLDQWESAPIEGFDTRVLGANDYTPAAGSELVVVTAGIARKPGMSRDDLVRTNADIVKQVSLQIKQHCPDAIVLVVSNPLDVMCWVTKQVTGFPRERVIGMAGVLDTARYRAFLAEALDVSVEDIQAMVLGGHGDTMVPLISYTTVAGIPVTHFLSKPTLDKIVERTRNGGAEIVAFLKTGSAYYAPSAAVVQMVEAIVRDKKRVLPCAAWLEGEYGLSGIYCGVPCKLGRKGLERIIDVKLSPEEQAALKKSADAVKETMAAVSLKP